MSVVSLVACPDCGTLLHPERIANHLLVRHGQPQADDDRPTNVLDCPECGKTCVDSRGLAVHRRHAHGIPGKGPATRPRQKPTPPPVVRTPSPMSAWDTFLFTIRGDVTGWHHEAACRAADVDPAWFWPSRGQSNDEARAVCARCPVRQRCLDDALSRGEWADHGIWGGTSERERRRLRIARRREQRP